MAVSPDGSAVYVAEIGPNTVWKFLVDRSSLADHHEAEKKGGHPESVAGSEGDGEETVSQKTQAEEEGSDFGVSLIIGGLLIVPVVVVIGITIFLRIRRAGRCINAMLTT